MHGLALPIIAYILILNVNPLKSGGQWGYSGTNEISWIRLYASLS